jgi:kanamycin kinase/aminoglycoside 3'-phosphotransferase-2
LDKTSASQDVPDEWPPTWIVRTNERPGVAADRPAEHGQVEGLVDGLANALRMLHDHFGSDDLEQYAVAGKIAGLQTGWESLSREITAAVAEGRVDPATLPDPYRRYEAKRLLEFWVEGRPASEDLVLCHGNPRLSNFFFEGADFVGAEGLAGMRLADRHLDLAIIHHEIHEHLGAEAGFRFYEAYGRDPDLLKLDHYLLASLLRR